MHGCYKQADASCPPPSIGSARDHESPRVCSCAQFVQWIVDRGLGDKIKDIRKSVNPTLQRGHGATCRVFVSVHEQNT